MGVGKRGPAPGPRSEPGFPVIVSLLISKHGSHDACRELTGVPHNLYIYLEPQNVILLGTRVFADVISG